MFDFECLKFKHQAQCGFVMYSDPKLQKARANSKSLYVFCLDLNTTIQSAKGPQTWMYTLKGLIREMHAAWDTGENNQHNEMDRKWNQNKTWE